MEGRSDLRPAEGKGVRKCSEWRDEIAELLPLEQEGFRTVPMQLFKVNVH